MRFLLSICGLTALMLTAPPVVHGAEVIYKWIDANGQQHFSDVPREGAERVVVATPQGYSPPVADTTVGPEAEDSAGTSAEDAAGYTSVTITSPSEEETIWNTGGTISVSLNLQPGLKQGHRVRILVDRQRTVQLPSGATSIRLGDIFRGTHQLQAQVIASNGDVIASSPTVTFYYKQTSVNRTPGTPPAPSP